MTVTGALRAATIALLATAAVVAAPVSLFAQDIACDAGDKEVRALEFRGNNAVRDDDLAIRVTTTPSSWARRKLNLWFADKRCLNADELQRDSLRLKEYYRQRGYYSARIETVVQPIDPGAVRVIFNIDEGQPVRLSSYNVTGLTGVRDGASIMQRLRLRVGGAFDQGLFQADMDTIVQRLRNAGYYRVAVLHSWDTDTIARLATAGIEVLPGKPAKFGLSRDTVIPVSEKVGQQIKDEVVLRVLGIRAGDPYSDRAIVDAQRNLFQLGTYRHIQVAPLPDSLQPPGDTIVVLKVLLNEDYMRQLDSEIGWATLDCVRARLQYTDKNLFGKVRRLDLTGQVSKLGYGYPLASTTTRHMCTLGNSTDLKLDQFSDSLNYFMAATLRQPRLLGTRWVPTVSLYSERRSEFRAYLRSTPIGADFSATRDVRERMPLRLAYTVEYGKTTAQPAAFCALFNLCDPDSRRPLSSLGTLGVASAALARIRTDNVINPGRGYTWRGELRTSATRALATSDTALFFNKGTSDLAWYKRIDSRNVLAFRIRAGAVVGASLRFNDPAGLVPTQERLFAGGPTSVRGFQQNELGPLVYIADRGIVQTVDVPAPGDTIFHFEASPDSLDLGRAVPLGGNSLLVTNFEYRFRDPFFLPNILQYVLFVDGGNVWTRGQDSRFMLTPGLGLRALTFVGPVQINVGYNGYKREEGALYFNPNVTTLLCVSPNNAVFYRRGTAQPGEVAPFVPIDETIRCNNDFTPPPRTRLLQRLTFTFSIGTDF